MIGFTHRNLYLEKGDVMRLKSNLQSALIIPTIMIFLNTLVAMFRYPVRPVTPDFWIVMSCAFVVVFFFMLLVLTVTDYIEKHKP